MTDTYFPEISVCKATKTTSHGKTGAQQTAAEGKDNRIARANRRGPQNPAHILFFNAWKEFFFPNCEGKGILWWIDEFLVLQCTLSPFFPKVLGEKRDQKSKFGS